MLEYLSPSTLDLIMECPQKFQLSKLEGLSGEGEPISTAFGTAWHTIKRLRSLGMSQDAAVAEAVSSYPATADYRNPAKLITAERMYTRRYGGPIIPVSPEAVEQETTLWIPGVPKPVKFIIDTLSILDANEGTGREKWLVDYKTTSRLEGNWIQQYRVSNQFKCYYVGAMLEHPDLAGIMVDLLHVTKGLSTEKGRRGKSEEEVEGIHFYRLFIRYTDFIVQEWTNTMAMGYLLYQFYQDHGFYPKNAPTACRAFGSSCVFLDICDAQTPEERERIKQTFTRKEKAVVENASGQDEGNN